MFARGKGPPEVTPSRHQKGAEVIFGSFEETRGPCAIIRRQSLLSYAVQYTDCESGLQRPGGSEVVSIL